MYSHQSEASKVGQFSWQVFVSLEVEALRVNHLVSFLESFHHVLLTVGEDVLLQNFLLNLSILYLSFDGLRCVVFLSVLLFVSLFPAIALSFFDVFEWH